MNDQDEIRDCLTRYCRGMDRWDRELAKSAYHDDAVDDHVGFAGPVDEFFDWAFGYHSGQVRHQHFISNISIDLDGDVAHTETYYLFVGTPIEEGAPLTVTGGRYVDRFERRDGRWAIAARACLPEWMTELPSLMGSAAAMAFVAQTGTVARDTTDSSYARPLQVRSTSD